jgi:hypothetical protein
MSLDAFGAQVALAQQGHRTIPNDLVRAHKQPFRSSQLFDTLSTT